MDELDDDQNDEDDNNDDAFLLLVNFHNMEGGGTPVALQVNVTLLLSRTVALSGFS